MKVTERGFMYAAHFLAGCMDFSVGILIVSMLGFHLGVDIPLPLYVLGAFLAVLPDMDLMSTVLWARPVDWNHHETLFHKPIVVLPLVIAVGISLGLVFGHTQLYAEVFFFCVLWHFIHDSFPYGGITWGWPLSPLYFTVTGAERPSDFEKRMRVPHPDWLVPTNISLSELVATVIFLVAAALFNQDITEIITVLVLLFVAFVGFVWVFSKKLAPSLL